MIGLALIPSLTITAMGLVEGELAVAGRAFSRWLIDVALVLVCSALVIGLKQALVHRRRALS